jgi:ankyrin repeat protein
MFMGWYTYACTLHSGLVPLHNACSYGHYEVAELLVKYNANVNAVDLWKFTPLHEAASKGKYEICKLLLKVLVPALLFVYDFQLPLSNGEICVFEKCHIGNGCV